MASRLGFLNGTLLISFAFIYFDGFYTLVRRDKNVYVYLFKPQCRRETIQEWRGLRNESPVSGTGQDSLSINTNY